MAGPSFSRGAARAVGLSAAAVLAALSFGRSLAFVDERGLWEDVLANNPSSFKGHTGVGQSLWRAGDAAGARASFEKALSFHPTYPAAFEGLTHLLVVQGAATRDLALLDKAVEMAHAMMRGRPKDPLARLCGSAAHLERGRVSGRAADFEESERLALSCLELGAPSANLFCLAAEAKAARGDVEGALGQLAESDRRGLAREETAITRARLLAINGREREAESVLRGILEANPFCQDAHAQLAPLCRRRGLADEAALHEMLSGRAAAPNR
jgi:tetratricopeptide (TPR) repeat protein